MTATLQHHGSLRRGRLAVCLIFLSSGAALGTWTARISTIKHDLELTDGQLSFALLALAAGGLAGMRLVGRLVDRHGSKPVMTPAALAVGAALVVPAYASSLLTLVFSLFTFGAVHGTLNVAMNANAVECERAHQRPLMSSFHALFSVGGFVGAAAGGVFAHAQLSSRIAFLTVGATIAALAALAVRWAPSNEADDAQSASTREDESQNRPVSSARRPSGKVLVLGALAFCTLVGEGAAADWSSVYMHDNLGSSAATAVAAFAAFSLMMTLGRLAGDRLVATFGASSVVRVCGTLASAGLTAGVLIGQPAAGIAGFACLGAGLSCVVPQVFSVAGNLNPAQAGRDLSRVVAMGYVGFLTGPVLIGSAAGKVGLPHALLILPLLNLFVTAAASAVRPIRDAPRE